MRLAALVLATTFLVPAPSFAQGCPPGGATGLTFDWCGPSGVGPAGGSVTGSFIQDANFRKGDTDADGDRQGFDLALRVPDPWLLSVPGAQFLLAVRSVLDTSQALPGAPPGVRPRQYDQVPTHVTLGYETAAVSAYVLAGVANDGTSVGAWHSLKTWEHDGPFRTSPLTSDKAVPLLGAQGRLDHVVTYQLENGARIAVAGTAFAQGTTLKAGAGAAAHVAVGNWESTPRFTVSDLPVPAVAGTGVWAGVEYERVAYERLTDALGTNPNRLSIVVGGSFMPIPGWPSLSITGRHMLTEQVASARTNAVGEYRASLTVPFPD